MTVEQRKSLRAKIELGTEQQPSDIKLGILDASRLGMVALRSSLGSYRDPLISICLPKLPSNKNNKSLI